MICADGLSRSSLRFVPGFGCDIRPGSRLGLGAVLSGDSSQYPAGRLTMAVSGAGYVGMTRLEGGRLNLAAAVNQDSLSGNRTADQVVRSILASCDLPIPAGMESAHWNGTPLLTRNCPKLADRRLFVLGDAAGYVEPFTGEGIAWALSAASDVVAVAQRGVARWDDGLARAWEQRMKRKESKERWMCRAISQLLKSPRLASCALSLCRLAPILPRAVVSHIAG